LQKVGSNDGKSGFNDDPLIVLLSEAQWCFSACGDAIVSNEMTESDSERGIGSSLTEISNEITEIVSEITEMVGHTTESGSEIIEIGRT
jgi:hypothetical protein